MISLSLVLQLFGPLYLGSAMASSSFQNLSAQSPRMPFLFSSSAGELFEFKHYFKHLNRSVTKLKRTFLEHREKLP
jgi:hypothetical protein